MGNEGLFVGIPDPKNVTILVVTVSGRGPYPIYMNIFFGGGQQLSQGFSKEPVYSIYEYIHLDERSKPLNIVSGIFNFK